MKALILNNMVVDVSDAEFPVSTEMSWLDCPKDCEIGWIEKDGAVSAPPTTPEEPYTLKRRKSYPLIGDQLDDLYKEGVFSASMAAKIKKVKDDNPKG